MAEFIDFAKLKRPTSPNTALIAPEGATPLASPDSKAPVFTFPAAELFARASAYIESRKDWRLVSADARAGRIRFVAISPLMKFKDDVDLAILPHGSGQSTLMAYSRSRIGYSDLGANAKRLAALIAALQLP